MRQNKSPISTHLAGESPYTSIKDPFPIKKIPPKQGR